MSKINVCRFREKKILAKFISETEIQTKDWFKLREDIIIHYGQETGEKDPQTGKKNYSVDRVTLGKNSVEDLKMFDKVIQDLRSQDIDVTMELPIKVLLHKRELNSLSAIEHVSILDILDLDESTQEDFREKDLKIENNSLRKELDDLNERYDKLLGVTKK